MTRIISSTIAQIVSIAYIGIKETKRDTVTDTRLVWNGWGDVQPVPADKAGLLLFYKDVWVTEDEFKAGVASGKYTKPNVPVMPVPEPAESGDIVLVDDGGTDEDAEDSEAVSEAVDEIKSAMLNMDIDKKPNKSALQAALPHLNITSRQVNRAWKELGGN